MLNISNSDKLAIMSCYSNYTYLIDVSKKENPFLMYKFDAGIGIVCDYAFHPNDELILMGGSESSDIVLYNIIEK